MSTSSAGQLTWSRVLGVLLRGENLGSDAAAWAMSEIMSGEATSAQVAGFAIALRARGESAEAVDGMVETMLANAAPVELSMRCVDIVGTGGDQAHTVNISTMGALVVAGAGVPVAKHGNRAASSSCGAADLLEELGIKIALDGPGVARCISEAGIGFFFAPQFHAGMRFAGPARKELGVPTVFNFLGPLSNPGRPAAQAVGCADSRMAPVMAEVLARRGVSALLFRGDDGLDELTTTTTSAVWMVRDGVVATTVLDPADLGIAAAQPSDLRGGDRTFNAAVARDLLAGTSGPVRDAVVLNAAAAISAYAGLPADPAELPQVMRASILRAQHAIDSGSASAVLDAWVVASNS